MREVGVVVPTPFAETAGAAARLAAVASWVEGVVKGHQLITRRRRVVLASDDQNLPLEGTCRPWRSATTAIGLRKTTVIRTAEDIDLPAKSGTAAVIDAPASPRVGTRGPAHDAGARTRTAIHKRLLFAERGG